MQIRLSTGTLRCWRGGDEDSLVLHANNRKVWINLLDSFPHPYTLADAQQWIQSASADTPLRNFAIEVEGCAVGSIGLYFRKDVYHRSAGIGYWLGETYWGRGIATEAVRAITDLPNMERIPPNPLQETTLTDKIPDPCTVVIFGASGYHRRIPAFEDRFAEDRYGTSFGGHLADAYTRLILDCMLGDATLYARGDSTDAAWMLISPIHEAWISDGLPTVCHYPAGTRGPKGADELLNADGRRWRLP
jgi:hypothetical protein